MPTLERFSTESLRDLVVTFRDTVKAHAGGLNRLNVYPVPDGDTGTNMARTLDAVVTEMETADADDLDATCDAISHGSLMGARGNSGVILSQIMRGFATTMKSMTPDSDERGKRFADALQAASAGAYQAVLKPIEGTILTVVRESAEAARTASDDGGSLADVVRTAREAGKRALDNTPEQLQVLKDAGVVDAGGAGFLLLLDSALHVVAGDPLPEAEKDDGTGGAVAAAFDAPAPERSGALKVGGAGEVDVADQRYEVMYFMDLLDERIEDFKQGWGAIGDSIVVVGGDGIWNCHVHTNDIGAAVEVALDLDGRPKQIRVTDLFEEVDDEHAKREAAMTGDRSASPSAPQPAAAGAGLPPVTTAVVGVCSGDGLVELFAQLGVQGVVTGGQTMNPSTAELLDTVEHVNAQQVVILPNNKNIIPVAEQVNALTTKAVVVVPTRSVAEGLAALIVYDPEATSAANGTGMVEAAASVTTGEVTQAVRDTNAEVGAIHKDDWIGIVKGDGIVSCAPDLFTTVVGLLDEILDDDSELITVITGDGADAATTESIEGWLGDHHGAVGVEVHDGGQPLYPYLFGVE
ncbi:DAK2 domain-containing protein [Ilumatobacter nonamiensis]|uniref:DAK2 domain-containing protein n=1 Tax=Ilumatobacter nonamiensis TaxID=467093 RepID=UPI00034AADCA|nr:DAK2 domain-containing protein [Ilumatobacter nonamiensis]